MNKFVNTREIFDEIECDFVPHRSLRNCDMRTVTFIGLSRRERAIAVEKERNRDVDAWIALLNFAQCKRFSNCNDARVPTTFKQ